RLDGADVTEEITTGAMGGILAARDSALVPALVGLDGLAASLASVVNTQHRLGFDASGAPGQDLFATGVVGSPGAVARGMGVLVSDPSALALASSPAPGDGANAQALAGLGARQDVVTVGATLQSFSGAIGTLSFQVGNASRKVQESADQESALRDQAVAAR